ncbi:uncharacterized protein CBL_06003 [Carabus blaptoides fortunei]
MMYSFEGNARRRPEQNLSGASRKESRDLLLKRAHLERQKREEQRRKLQSTLLIQSCIRSYLVRQRKKREERLSFDENEPVCDNTASLKVLLRKLLFFYDPHKDLNRLLRICEKLQHHHMQVLQTLDYDTSIHWLIRKVLVVCMSALGNNEAFDLCLKCIDTFTALSDSRQKIDIWPFLIKNGYFKHLRYLLDTDVYLDTMLKLINRPLLLLHVISPANTEIILSEFCRHFLCPAITDTVKSNLIPFLKSTNKFPHDELLRFLNDNHTVDATNNLLYCMLALEPPLFEPTVESIQVLSSLSINLHSVQPLIDLTDDDSDIEEMEISEEKLIPQDYMALLNNQERVKKILTFFDQHSENEQILTSLTQLCHNLLLCFKDSIHKYMLVYMLALRGTFLYRLWCSIKVRQQDEALSQQYSNTLSSWNTIQTSIAVFCSMFTLYSSTLTDTETDTASSTGIFSTEDLCNICEVMRNISVNLIDIAFPMCRSSMVPATRELIHLYRSCLNALRVLHTLDLRKHFCKTGFWTRKKIHISQDLSKRNYLSKTLKPFFGIVSEDEDEYLPPLLTVEQRSLAILQELPFLVEFNSRVLLLRDLCRSSINSMTNGLGFSHRDFMADSAIIIRRTHLYEDSFEKLSPENEPNLKHKVRIQFVNNAGLDEPGIDGGGIFKEFINEVLKTAFDPNRGFFLLTNDNLLYPNPNVHLIVEEFAKHYFFIGRLVGKALFENILVDLPLAEFFLEKLLVERVDAHHLRSLDPVLYRNLLYLRDYSGDVQDLGLDFTIASNDLGETRVIELKQNGRNIPVNNYNRLEYIHLLADFKLNKQIKRQCAAFRQGLDSVVPLLWLKLFSHYELQIIIGGDTQEMDITDLKNHTAYGGEFTTEHPTIIIFWKIVESFTDTQKKQLLKFVTSCSRPPLLGFKELSPSFCIQSAGSEDRMPTASTCLNLLKLPIINQEATLRDKLIQAIEQQAGFELS